MSIVVPEEVRRLFQVLTGEDMTDADEDALFVVAERLESGAATVETLGAVVGDVKGRVRGGFSGKAADRFAERLAGFVPVLEAGGVGLRELAGFVRNLALQVQYLKFVTVGGLLLLLGEVAWAVSMAGLTAGASMAWLAARFAVMRFLLSRWWGQLFVRLAVAQVVGIGLQVAVEMGAQGAQFALGTRKKWDGQLTTMAVGVGSFSALLAVPLSALGNVVANAITKVLVRGLGDEIDAEVLAAAAKNAVEEHADQYPLSSMARFADVVSKSLDDFTGMSVRAMWAARFGHWLGESLEEGLTEMFGEAGYGALSGQGAQWNPFSFTAGVSESVASGAGRLTGLVLRGQLIPPGTRYRDQSASDEMTLLVDEDSELKTVDGNGFSAADGVSGVGSVLSGPDSVVSRVVQGGWSGGSRVRAVGMAGGKTGAAGDVGGVPDGENGSVEGKSERAGGEGVVLGGEGEAAAGKNLVRGGAGGTAAGKDGVPAAAMSRPGVELADGSGSEHRDGSGVTGVSIAAIAGHPAQGGVASDSGEPSHGADVTGHRDVQDESTAADATVHGGLRVAEEDKTAIRETSKDFLLARRFGTVGAGVMPGEDLHGTPPPAYSTATPYAELVRPATPPPAYSPAMADVEQVGHSTPPPAYATESTDGQIGEGTPPVVTAASRDSQGVAQLSGVDSLGAFVDRAQRNELAPAVRGTFASTSPAAGASPDLASSAPSHPRGQVNPDGIPFVGREPWGAQTSDQYVPPGEASRPQVSAPVVDSSASEPSAASSAASGVTSDSALPTSGPSTTIEIPHPVETDGQPPLGRESSRGETIGHSGSSGVDVAAGYGDSPRPGGAVAEALDSLKLPSDAVRVQVPPGVISGGGVADFLRSRVAESAGGPVVVASGDGSGSGVVVLSGQASGVARDLGRDVVALVPVRGRGLRWMRFAADGSRPRPVDRWGRIEAPERVVEGGAGPGGPVSAEVAARELPDAEPVSVVDTAVAEGGAAGTTVPVSVAQWSVRDLRREVDRARAVAGPRDPASLLVQHTHDVTKLAGHKIVSVAEVVELVAARRLAHGSVQAYQFSRELAAWLGTEGDSLAVHAAAGSDSPDGAENSYAGITDSLAPGEMMHGLVKFDPLASEPGRALLEWAESADDLGSWWADQPGVGQTFGFGGHELPDGQPDDLPEADVPTGGAAGAGADGVAAEWFADDSDGLSSSAGDVSGSAAVVESSGRKRSRVADSGDDDAESGTPRADVMKRRRRVDLEPVWAEVRRAGEEGEPHTAATLAEVFGKSKSWGHWRLKEFRKREGGERRVDVAKRKREVELEPVWAEVRRAGEAGEPHTGRSLAAAFGKSAGWGTKSLGVFREQEGGEGRATAAKRKREVELEPVWAELRRAEDAGEPHTAATLAEVFERNKAWGYARLAEFRRTVGVMTRARDVELEKVWAEVRRAEEAGEPQTGQSLGKKFGKAKSWGCMRLAEFRRMESAGSALETAGSGEEVPAEGVDVVEAERLGLVSELVGLVGSLRGLLVGAPEGYRPGLRARVEDWWARLERGELEGVDVVGLRSRVAQAAVLVERVRAERPGRHVGGSAVGGEPSAGVDAVEWSGAASELSSADVAVAGSSVQGEPARGALGWRDVAVGIVGGTHDVVRLARAGSLDGVVDRVAERVRDFGRVEALRFSRELAVTLGSQGSGLAIRAGAGPESPEGAENSPAGIVDSQEAADEQVGGLVEVDPLESWLERALLEWAESAVGMGSWLGESSNVGQPSGFGWDEFPAGRTDDVLAADLPVTGADVVAAEWFGDDSGGLSSVGGVGGSGVDGRSGGKRAHVDGSGDEGAESGRPSRRRARRADVARREAVLEEVWAELRRADEESESHTGVSLGTAFGKGAASGRQRLAEFREREGDVSPADPAKRQREAAWAEVRRADEAGEPHTGESLAKAFRKSGSWGSRRLAELRERERVMSRPELARREREAELERVWAELRRADEAGESHTGVSLGTAFGKGAAWGRQRLSVFREQEGGVSRADVARREREAALAEVRRADEAGEPHTGESLGKKFGKGVRWGCARLKEFSVNEGMTSRGDVLRRERKAALAELRRADEAGEPHSAASLGKKFGKSASWGYERLAELGKSEGVVSPADTAKPQRARVQAEVVWEEVRRARDAGQPHTDVSLAEKFGKSKSWGYTRLAAFRAAEEDLSRTDATKREVGLEAVWAEVRRARDAGEPHTGVSLAEKFGKSGTWGSRQLLSFQVSEGDVNRTNAAERVVESEEVWAEVRRADEAGEPHSGASLGKKFGKGKWWGHARLKEFRAMEGGASRAEVAQREVEEVWAELRRARDAGESHSGASLGRVFGKSRSWGTQRLAEFRSHEGGGSTPEALGFGSGMQAGGVLAADVVADERSGMPSELSGADPAVAESSAQGEVGRGALGWRDVAVGIVRGTHDVVRLAREGALDGVVERVGERVREFGRAEALRFSRELAVTLGSKGSGLAIRAGAGSPDGVENSPSGVADSRSAVDSVGGLVEVDPFESGLERALLEWAESAVGMGSWLGESSNVGQPSGFGWEEFPAGRTDDVLAAGLPVTGADVAAAEGFADDLGGLSFVGDPEAWSFDSLSAGQSLGLGWDEVRDGRGDDVLAGGLSGADADVVVAEGFGDDSGGLSSVGGVGGSGVDGRSGGKRARVDGSGDEGAESGRPSRRRGRVDVARQEAVLEQVPAELRRADEAGEPHTGESLGAKFGMSAAWGALRLAEFRESEGGVSRSESARLEWEAAWAEVRRADEAGEPHSGVSLAEAFGKSWSWGLRRLAEFREREGGVGRAELARREREAELERVWAELRRADEAGEPHSGVSLAEAFGKSWSWGLRRLAEFREREGGVGRAELARREREAELERVWAELRRADEAGEPHTGESLGKKFGKSLAWGCVRLKEFREREGGVSRAESARREREEAWEEVRRADEAGEPHTGVSLAEVFGKGASWGVARLAEFREREGGVSRAESARQEREEAWVEVRRADEAGEPHTGESLGKKFGKSASWGQELLAELGKNEGVVSRADAAKPKRERARAEVVWEEMRRARDAGEPHTDLSLGAKFGKSRSWGYMQLLAFRAAEGDVSRADAAGRDEVWAEVRRADEAGEPHTSLSLGKKFGKSRSWGLARLKEFSAMDGGASRAEGAQREVELEEVWAEVRRADEAGEPHTGASLGKKFAKGKTWGRMRLKEFRAMDGGVSRAEVAQREVEEVWAELRRARDAGESHSGASLGKKFGKGKSWGGARLREFRSREGGGSTPEASAFESAAGFR
ncbi:WXG100-like domain-containing protein [Saccharopolyspora phatthalungensis]|uniref:DNA-binding transcriptional regulator YdaS (Cro superfamily) n=1 Tax=Saccharopolyspora phatthalungensis TaxID=664693 RepID=A0A840QHQ6_9PSEU|nr:hypothetical protein [Saccharopolyspora phatthalungensis]MBB5159727.1 DNA-binding transcriptional regulator YdaS (Cro superfamily) [Saccharopolyspora phatthalungensis]